MFHRNKSGSHRVGGKLPSSVLLQCVCVLPWWSSFSSAHTELILRLLLNSSMLHVCLAHLQLPVLSILCVPKDLQGLAFCTLSEFQKFNPAAIFKVLVRERTFSSVCHWSCGMNQLRGSVFLRGTWKNHHYVFCLDVRNNVTCRVTDSQALCLK